MSKVIIEVFDNLVEMETSENGCDDRHRHGYNIMSPYLITKEDEVRKFIAEHSFDEYGYCYINNNTDIYAKIVIVQQPIMDEVNRILSQS